MRTSACWTSCRSRFATRNANAKCSPRERCVTCRAGSRRMELVLQRWCGLEAGRGKREAERREDESDNTPPMVADFLTHLEKERDVSPNTLLAYRRDLEEFVGFLGAYYGAREWTWQGLDRLAIRGFLAHLTRRKLNKRSIARALSAVRSFYRYLHRNELVDANPARAVKT